MLKISRYGRIPGVKGEHIDLPGTDSRAVRMRNGW